MIYIIMNLQRQEVSKYKNKTYYKYSILVPKNIIEKLGWVKGQKLEATPIINNGLFISCIG